MSKPRILAPLLPFLAVACSFPAQPAVPEQPARGPAAKGEAAPARVTAEDLSDAYGKDAKAADRKYGERLVELMGATYEPVGAVANSVKRGKPAVLLYGRNGPRVRCYFRPAEGKKIRDLGPNSPVALVGRVRPRRGAEEGPIVVEDCKYLD
jgi:hypothetical protein